MKRWVRSQARGRTIGHDAYWVWDRGWSVDETCRGSAAAGSAARADRPRAQRFIEDSSHG